MDDYTPIAEVNANRHPILVDSEQYQIVRCAYDFNRETGENTIMLTLAHRTNQTRRRLRFTGVSCNHSLDGCIGVYILDTSYRQWEKRVRVEVGEFYEDGGVYFRAASVEEMAAE
jgi:hypothetical protein